MRRFAALAGTLSLLLVASVASANLVITEVCDGTRAGGAPKWVELTNTGALGVDLSLYSFGNMNNGATTLGGGASTVLPAVALGAGQSFIVSYEADPGVGQSVFEQVYGFAPGIFMGGGFINGDDVVILFNGPATGDGSDATIADLVGEIGVDGTGTAWEWLDSYGNRNPWANAGSSVWSNGRFTFAGPNALDAPDDPSADALMLANTTPGSHTTNVKGVPAPGAPTWVIMLMALALLGAGFFAVNRMKVVNTA